MRYFLISILTSLLFIACSNKNEPRPSTIYVTIKVTDKETSLPIESVKAVIVESAILTIATPTGEKYYTNENGIISFSLNPEKNCLYHIEFTRKSDEYEPYEVLIDLDEEQQYFNVNLTKKQL